MMNEKQMKDRTKKFCYRAIDLAAALPNTDLGRIVSKQLMRACTSVASNYRAACRGKSSPDFIYKLGVVEEEADECMFWMELIMDKKLQLRERVEPLYKEADEILSIIVASIRTSRENKSPNSQSSTKKPPEPRPRNPKSKIQNPKSA
jgi:four helix bundle protein